MPTTRTPTAQTQTATIPTPEFSALEQCIEPIASGEFLGAVWEREPLLIERGEEGRFDDLLSASEVEGLVCSGALRYPAFRLVSAAKNLDLADYTESIPWRPQPFSGSAAVERVISEFEAGATIVLQGLHLHWPRLSTFCRKLEEELDQPVQANAYYTPRDSQGLPVHHDTHEVFVLQVSGDKRWLVYEPILELPLGHQRYTAELGAPGSPVLDVTLKAGDTLYLPRGWLHQALTSQEDSLHLTIGVKVYTWLEAFKSALESCENDVSFRRSVPGDGAGGEALLEKLRERLDAATVAARRKEKLVRTRRPVLEGQLTQLRRIDELAVDTLLERRATVIASVRSEDGQIVLSYEGKDLSFPARLRDEINFLIAGGGRFCASDLPGTLDEDSRLVLVSRLIREGFLIVSG